jgi:hypothetical protein
MNSSFFSRSGWVKYALLVPLAAGGVTVGLYLSGALPMGRGVQPEALPPVLPYRDAQPAPQRFALSALDVKDQIEAPSLAVDSADRVFLAWASKTGIAERTVFLSQAASADLTFGAPIALGKAGVYRTTPKTPGSKSGGHERRATPHVRTEGQNLHVAWSEALPDGSSMRMVLVTSTDAGASFSAPSLVHRGQAAKPTFTGFATGPGGRFACTWLDDRAGVQQPFAAVRPSGREQFEEELLVHPGQDGVGVCPCCPTAAVFGADGTLFVAFRNVREGYRDIAICRKKPGQSAFEPAVAVVPPAWKFEGCPHDGPSLAIAGDHLHIVWMDARSGTPRCWYARSGLDALQFEARELNPSAPGSQGNARLFADAAGGLHAVWEESLGAEKDDAHSGHTHAAPQVGGGGGRAILVATMPPGLPSFGSGRPVAPKPGVFQTRPAVVSTARGDLVIAWNELDESGKAVVVMHLPAPTLTSRANLQ